MRAHVALLPLALCALACGLGEEPPPPAPLEPLPLVLPQWVMGTWERVVEVDERQVVELGCDGTVQALEVAEGGRVALTLGGARSEGQGTAVDLRSDGGVTVHLDGGGRVELVEQEPGVLRVKAPGLGLAEAAPFVAAGDTTVEHLLASAARCGGAALDTSGLRALRGTRFASPGGDPCMKPGLELWLDRSPPRLQRAGIDYRIEAARPVEEGTWLTVVDAAGHRHGMRLDPQPDGSVRFWQRTAAGMRSELLQPTQGLCR